MKYCRWRGVGRCVMTVPGVGPLIALAYATTVANSRWFPWSTDVGTYLGLTPRRYQSIAIARPDGVSKCGDRLTPSLLYEAACTQLFRNREPSRIQTWVLELVKRIGHQKACAAVAQTLSVFLLRLWMKDCSFKPAGFSKRREDQGSSSKMIIQESSGDVVGIIPRLASRTRIVWTARIT